jgi:Anti-sigma factor NepR
MAKQDKPQNDAVFDGWLNHHLSQLYDPVIQEPIPEDLLKLLEERLG